MLSSSGNILITGGTFISQVNHVKSPFERLQDATSPAAFHDSAARFDPPKCHPNTRVVVLEQIMEWILGNENRDALIMWLFGPAGAGKSAILQTIAELCAARRILLASFFFSRTDSTRNHGSALFPTLAYQISSIIPGAREPIEAIINRDPLVFSRSIDVHLESLVMGPLRHLFDAESLPCQDESVIPTLIIIDGLDECHDSAVQCSVLNAISNTLRRRIRHLTLRFLIASRPEQDISLAFNHGHLNSITTRVALDDSYLPCADIDLYLREHFTQIKQSHPSRRYIPSSWPSDEVLQHLVGKSSGQFIYASTVIKYVKSTRHLPTERLEIILGIRSTQRDLPFAELDALYLHILSLVEDIETIYNILSLAMDKKGKMEYIPFAEKFLSLSPGTIPILLGDLASIISCERSHVTFLHASFSDFLFDSARSQDFYINPGLRYAQLLGYCMRQMYSVSTDNSTNISLNYATAQMPYFCANATPTDELYNQMWHFSLLNFNQESASRDMRPSLSFMEQFLSGIKKLKFEDVDQLYNHHLKQFDQFWISLLDTYFINEDQRFDCLVVFGQYGISEQVVQARSRKGTKLEDVVLKIYKGLSGLDGSRFLKDGEELARFLEDPSRSGKYAVDSEKYVTAALLCFKCAKIVRWMDGWGVKVFQLVLSHLAVLLRRSMKSEELVDVSRQHTFLPSQYQGPEKQEAVAAIAEYLARCG